MDLSFDITLLGMIVLAAGALVIGVAAQIMGEPRSGYEWLVAGAAAFVGGFVGSEYLGLQAFAPVWDGLALIPAIVGGVVVGGLAEVATRVLVEPVRTHSARPI